MKRVVVLPDIQYRTHPEWPDYLISSQGEVISYARKTPRLLKGTPDQDGYLRYQVGGKGGKRRGGHQLVLEAFHPEGWFEEAKVLHVNGDPSDNRLENLYWGTSLDNTNDRRKHGTLGLRLTDEDVEEIRRLHAMGFQQREISRVFKTTQKHVSDIVLRKVRV